MIKNFLHSWQPAAAIEAERRATHLGDHDTFAFISYSHEDRRIARRWHHQLESYRVPKALREQHQLPRSVFPIFWDRTGLNATGDGQDELLRQLRRAKYLLVICSPHAVRSQWVNWEIAQFKRIHAGDGTDRVLGIIVAGHPFASMQHGRDADECYPAAMRFRVDTQGQITTTPAEPFAPDERPAADGRTHTRLRIIARILETDIETLRRRDRERRIRRITSATTVAATLAIVFALVTAAAVKGYRLADRRGAELRRGFYHSSIALAEAEYERNHIARMREVLATCLDPRLAPYRDWEWHRLNTLADGARHTLTGHTGTINALALVPDGRRLLSGADDRQILLWDVTPAQPAGGRLLGPVGTLPGRVLAVTSDATGRTVAAGDADGVARVWDVPAEPTAVGRERVTCRQSVPVFAVALNPQGTRLATGGDCVRVWDVDPASTNCGTVRVTLTGHTRAVSALVFSDDGTRLVTGSADETSRVWDPETGAELLHLNGLHLEGVTGVAIAADRSHIASASKDGTIKLWDADESGRVQLTADGPGGTVKRRKPQALATYAGHDGDVLAVSFSADARLVASAGVDTTVRLWDVLASHPRRVLRGHVNPVTSVRFSPLPDDSRLFSAGGLEIKIWDSNDSSVLMDRGEVVQSVAFSPVAGDDRLVAADGAITVWRHSETTPLAEWNTTNVCLVAFVANASLIAAASDGGRLELYGADPAQTNAYGRVVQTLASRGRPWHAIAANATGTHLAGAAAGGEVQIWNVDPASTTFGSRLATLSGPAGRDVLALAFSPDGRHLLTASQVAGLSLWALPDTIGAPIGHARTLPWPAAYAGERTVYAVAFSPDGQTLAAGTWAGHVLLWPADPMLGHAPEATVSWKAHDAGISTMTFTPSGKRLITGSWDESLKVWDVESPRELLQLRAPPMVRSFYNPIAKAQEAKIIVQANPINSVACSADGAHLAASGRQLSLWRTAGAIP